MRLKLPNDILLIDILSGLLILSIVLVSSTPARVILGLPFLLFFPGYSLVAAIFAKKETMDGLERAALSVGMSIAVVGLIGFGLSYTPWGVRLEPVLAAVTAFILVMSAIALVRRGRARGTNVLTMEITSFPGWGGNALNKSLSIVLAAVIFGTLGVIGYAVAAPKIGEGFTEFYVLGAGGKAQDYPTTFTLDNSKVTQVVYGDGVRQTAGEPGIITVGIENHQLGSEVYFVRMTINGESVTIDFGGARMGFLGPIELSRGEKWENSVGVVPESLSDNQKVELLLFRGNKTTPESSLHFWINVRGAR